MATVAAAAAAAAPAAAGRQHRPKVAVVGAGFAGLAAALTLQRSGCCDVVVLEAGSRPGGRACTQQLSAGMALELGATWFHGLGTPEEPNPVFAAAVQQGLIDKSPTAEKWWNSQFLLPGTAQPLSKEQQIAVTHALAAWGKAVEGLGEDAGGTSAEHLQAAWEQLLASGRLDAGQVALAQRAWRWREHLQRAMDGCDSTADQSAQGLALYDEMPGGVHTALPAGMQTVAERLAAEVSDLRFGHAVQRISWSSPAATSSGSRVRIACANGASVDADVAVVTVSLGVLKAEHGQLFDPPLPAEKAAAIQRLRIGTVDKLFLDFEPPAAAQCSRQEAGAAAGTADGSWPEPAVSFALLWSESWQGGSAGSSSGSSKAAAGIAEDAAPDEAQVPEWAKGIFSLRFGGPEVKQLQDGGSHGQAQQAQQQAAQQQQAAAEEEDEAEYNPCAEARQPTCYTAVAWLTGEAAAAMEAAADEEVLAAVRQLAVLFPQMQLPPGASWDRVRLYRSRWGSDPLFRGSYSYLGPNSSPADVAALAAPVYASAPAGAGSRRGGSSSGSSGSEEGAPVLLFAGEACHVRYIGTMHGAFLTGRAAAETLLQHWQGGVAEQPAVGS